MKHNTVLRRIACGALALLLAVSLCVPVAFAEDPATPVASEPVSSQSVSSDSTDSQSDQGQPNAALPQGQDSGSSQTATPPTLPAGNLSLLDYVQELHVLLNGTELTPGASLTVGDTFELTLSYVLKNTDEDGAGTSGLLANRTLEYTFPDGIVFPQNITNPILLGGSEGNADSYGSYTVSGNKLLITYNDRLSSFGGNMAGSLGFHAQMNTEIVTSEGTGVYEFAGVGGSVTLSSITDVSGNKTYRNLTESGNLLFDIAIKPNAFVKNMTVSDILGTDFRFVKGSFQLLSEGAVLRTEADGGLAVAYNDTVTTAADGRMGTTASISLGDLAGGKEYHLIYEASIDPAQADPADTNHNHNFSQWVWDGGQPQTGEVTVDTKAQAVQKSGKVTDATKGTIHWTATFNNITPRQDLRYTDFADVVSPAAGSAEQVLKKGSKVSYKNLDAGKNYGTMTIQQDNDWAAVWAKLNEFIAQDPTGRFELQYDTTAATALTVGTKQSVTNTVSMTMHGTAYTTSASATVTWDVVGADTTPITPGSDTLQKTTTDIVEYRNGKYIAKWLTALTLGKDTTGAVYTDEFSSGSTVNTSYVMGSLRVQYRKTADAVLSDIPESAYELTVNKNSFVVTFKKDFTCAAGTYTFSYETQSEMKSSLSGNNSSFTISNTAKYGTLSSKAQAAIQNPVWKSAKGWQWDSSKGIQKQLWNFSVNDNGGYTTKQDYGDASFTLTDTLQDGLRYLEGSTSMSLADPGGLFVNGKRLSNDGGRRYALTLSSTAADGKGGTVYHYTVTNSGGTVVDSTNHAIQLDMAVNAAGNTITWTLAHAGQKRLYVDYASYLDAEGPLQDAYDKLDSGASLSVSNDLRFSINDVEQGKTSTTNTVKKNWLTKEAVQAEGSAVLPYITYTVRLNQNSENINPNGDTLTLTDTFDNSLGSLVLTGDKRVRVYKGNTTEELAGAVIQYPNNVLTVTVPDNTYCRVVYTVLPFGTPAPGTIFTNKAMLKGQYTYTITNEHRYQTVTGIGSITGSSNAVTVQKVDKASATKVLPGAVFALYRVSKVATEPDGTTPLSLAADTQTTNADGRAVFSADTGNGSGKLSFDTLYYFTETTAPQGYKLDTTKHFFVLSSQYASQSTLEAQAAKLGGGKITYVTNATASAVISVENAQQPTSTKLTLKGTKTLTGAQLVGKQFTFELRGTDNASALTVQKAEGAQTDSAKQPVLRAQNTPNGSFTFAALTFTELGTYHYTLAEQIPETADGISYDKTVYDVTVQVDNFDDVPSYKLAKQGSSDEVTALTFANTASTTITLNGVKTLDGAAPAANAFSFLLQGVNDAGKQSLADVTGAVDDAQNPGFKMLTATNDATGNFTFGPIPYAKSGTYVYTVTEQLGSTIAGGIHYDGTVHNVIVTVTDRSGRLSADYTIDDKAGGALTFANTTVSPAVAALGGSKALTSGGSPEANAYTFVLQGADDASGKTVQNAKGAAQNAAGAWQLTAKNDDTGAFRFAELSYSTPGTYLYTIGEQAGSTAGVTYDTAVYYASVTVTQNGSTLITEAPVYTLGAPAGSAGAKDAAGVLFTNTVETKITFSGEKALKENGANVTGDKLAQWAGRFTFTLTETDDTFAPLTGGTSLQTQNAADGSFTFGADAITYNTAGRYYYVLAENNAGHTVNGVVYGPESYRITVLVKQHLGGLSAEVETAERVLTATTTEPVARASFAGYRFENYRVVPAEDVLRGRKALDGAVPAKAGGFTFLAEEYTSGAFTATLPSATNAAGNALATLRDASGKAAVSVTSADAAKGEFTFATRYDKAGTYFYKITEQMPADLDANGVSGGIVYDTRAYYVTAEVTQNPDGTLRVTKTMRTAVGNGPETAEALFENYKEISVTLGGNKILVNHAASSVTRTFGFLLQEKVAQTGGQVSLVSVGTATASVTAGANAQQSAQFNFSPIVYSAEGSHIYLLTELNTALPGVAYSTAEYTVIVDVSKTNGRLTSSVRMLDASGNPVVYSSAKAQFTNEFTPASLALSGVKYLTGSNTTAPQRFSFTLAADAANPAGSSIAGDGRAEITMQGDGTAPISFPLITYTEEGTYQYTITETAEQSEDGLVSDTGAWAVTVNVHKDAAGTALTVDPATDVTYSRIDYGQAEPQDSIWFSNVGTKVFGYLRSSLVITGAKTLDGAAPADGQFRFDLLDAPNGNVVATAKNSADGSFNFRLSFGSGTSFTYYVREQNHGQTINGITYSNDLYKVSVTLDPAVGSINYAYELARGYYADPTATPTWETAAGISFDNTALTEVAVTKIWDDAGNETARPSEITVRLMANGTDTGRTLTLRPGTTGTAWTGSFTGLPTLDAGTPIIYTVQEDSIPAYVGVVTNTTPENAVNKISYTITNTFDAAAMAYVDPLVYKALRTADGTDMSLTAGQFTFGLYEIDPAGALGTSPVSTAQNLADGSVMFPVLSFARVGTYRYAIQEIAGKDPQIGYALDVIYATITVEADSQNGSLHATVAYTDKDGNTLGTSAADGTVTGKPTIVNQYHDIVMRIRKTSRNDAAIPLVGAMYGLYRVNNGGTADFLVTSAVSDADGYMNFSEGLALNTLYYVKEIEPPDGYIVDPYPSDTFYFYRDANGDLQIVYAASVPVNNAAPAADAAVTDGAPLSATDASSSLGERLMALARKQAAEAAGVSTVASGEFLSASKAASVELLGAAADSTPSLQLLGADTMTGKSDDTQQALLSTAEAPAQSTAALPSFGSNIVTGPQVSDPVAQVTVFKLDGGTGSSLAGAQLQISDAAGTVIDAWSSDAKGHVTQLNASYTNAQGVWVQNNYTLREVSAPNGYAVAKDTVFYITSNGASAIVVSGPATALNGSNTLNLTNTRESVPRIQRIYREIVTQITRTAPKTGDTGSLGVALGAVLAGLGLLIFQQERKRRHKK